MIEVEKRDGSIVGFDPSKIFSAISKAFDSLHMEKTMRLSTYWYLEPRLIFKRRSKTIALV